MRAREFRLQGESHHLGSRRIGGLERQVFARDGSRGGGQQACIGDALRGPCALDAGLGRVADGGGGGLLSLAQGTLREGRRRVGGVGILIRTQTQQAERHTQQQRDRGADHQRWDGKPPIQQGSPARLGRQRDLLAPFTGSARIFRVAHRPHTVSGGLFGGQAERLLRGDRLRLGFGIGRVAHLDHILARAGHRVPLDTPRRHLGEYRPVQAGGRALRAAPRRGHLRRVERVDGPHAIILAHRAVAGQVQFGCFAPVDHHAAVRVEVGHCRDLHFIAGGQRQRSPSQDIATTGCPLDRLKDGGGQRDRRGTERRARRAGHILIERNHAVIGRAAHRRRETVLNLAAVGQFGDQHRVFKGGRRRLLDAVAGGIGRWLPEHQAAIGADPAVIDGNLPGRSQHRVQAEVKEHQVAGRAFGPVFERVLNFRAGEVGQFRPKRRRPRAEHQQPVQPKQTAPVRVQPHPGGFGAMLRRPIFALSQDGVEFNRGAVPVEQNHTVGAKPRQENEPAGRVSFQPPAQDRGRAGRQPVPGFAVGQPVAHTHRPVGGDGLVSPEEFGGVPGERIGGWPFGQGKRQPFGIVDNVQRGLSRFGRQGFAGAGIFRQGCGARRKKGRPPAPMRQAPLLDRVRVRSQMEMLSSRHGVVPNPRGYSPASAGSQPDTQIPENTRRCSPVNDR